MKLLALLIASTSLAILLRPHAPSLYVEGPSRGITGAYSPTIEVSPTPTPSSVDVAQAIVKEFAPEGKQVVKQMLDISFCESGWRWDAINHNTNGTTDHGSMQINTVHRKRYGTGFENSLEENIRVAHEIWKASGTAPWVCSRVLGMR